MKDAQNMPRLDSQKIEKKLRAASALFRMALETKKFLLRQKHPNLTERELNHRAYALIELGCR